MVQPPPAPPTPPPEVIVVPDVPPPEVIIQPEIFSSGGPADFIPIVGMLGGVVMVGMFLMGPVGRAIGDIIRHWFGAKAAAGKGALPADVDDLHARLDQMQAQMAELAERQDFSERLLAQVRREKDKVLPGGDSVAR